MSNSKLSFSIALKLVTDQFNRGAASVKSTLRSMQMHFISFTAALGAGTIGLSNFVSRMIETAKETSRVNTALKNVSGSTEAYLGHQEYLIGLSNKYGVQINSLTGGFAKFKAAADAGNMTLADQYKIFESLSRASVAFGVNAEDQKGVFLALSQMMSKGKVQAEELRLQLGERLPVAIQAMAKAAGVEIEDLDKLMKQGKIYAADVLPRFAEALNEMIPNVDTDNLNASLSRLSNTFTEFTKNADIEGKFKRIVEAAAGLFTWLGQHVKLVFGAIAGVVGLGLGNAARKGGNSIVREYDQATAAAAKAVDRLAARRAAAERAQAAVDKAAADVATAREAEKLLVVEASEARKEAARRRTARAEAILYTKNTALIKAQEAERRAAAKVTADAQAAAAAKGAAGWTRFGNILTYGVGRAIKSLGTMLKSLAVSTVWTALIAGAAAFLGWLVKSVAQARELRKIVSDTRKELDAPISDTQADLLRANQNIFNDQNASDKKRLGALREINSLLGTSYEFEKNNADMAGEVNRKIEERVKLLYALAKQQRAQEVASQRRAELEELKSSEDYKEVYDKAYNKPYGTFGKKTLPEIIEDWEAKEQLYANQGKIAKTLFPLEHRDYQNAKARFDNLLSKYPLRKAEELEKAILIAESDLKQATGEVAELGGNKPVAMSPAPLYNLSGESGKKTELEKQREKYAESLKALDEKLSKSMISQREYDAALHDLTEKTYIAATASDDAEILSSDFYKQIKARFDRDTHGEEYERQQEIADAIEEYRKAVEARKNELANGTLTERAYRNALFELAKELRSNIASKVSPFVTAMNPAYVDAVAVMQANAPKPELTTRDTSYDYQKTDTEILDEELSVAKHNLDILRQAAAENAGMFIEELNHAMDRVKTLEDALKIKEAQDAIKTLSKEYKLGLYEGTKGVVGNVDGIVSAFERIGDVMSDADASGWEKIMSVWEAMTSLTDGVLQTIELIERLTRVKERLTKAEEAEAVVSNAASKSKIQNVLDSIAADTAETTNIVANSGAKIGAKQGEAAAEAGASAAKLPFPANILAIGGAIAAVMAAFATIPRFEKGGIVGGGPAQGDKILARLNAGELILNQAQQGTLYGLLNNRPAGNVHVTGEFKVRGRDLEAVISNNRKFRQRVG